jgi:hypothetical protein
MLCVRLDFENVLCGDHDRLCGVVEAAVDTGDRERRSKSGAGMDFQSLVAKYLRLRKDLLRVANPSHAKRLREEMQQLESRLVESCIPFSDTLPLAQASVPAPGESEAP